MIYAAQMSTTTGPCLTCNGTGESVTELGPEACPDCFGEGRTLGQGAKLEWRLRELERTYRGSGRETEADVLWLVNEVRRHRDTLLRILARCQDADDADATAREIKFTANETIGLYDPQ
jgi:hypothetical protein